MNEAVAQENVAQLPAVQAPKLPNIQAGGAVRAIVPQDFDSAWRIANAVCKAGMAPAGLEAPEKAMVAIMHGLEVGFTPMNALQSIAVVNGRPTIYGDGAIGLVRGSGLLEWIEETWAGEGDNFAASCTVKRKNEPKPIRGAFSIADAKAAKLWGKSGPWTQYPKRMLQFRARAFALRDGFADVLKGLAIKEEIEDIVPIRDVTPPSPPAPPSPPTVPVMREADDTDAPAGATVVWEETAEDAGPPSPPPPAPPAPSPKPGGIIERAQPTNDPGDIPPVLDRRRRAKPAAPNADDPKTFLAWIDTTLGAVTDPDALETVWNDSVAPHAEKLFPPDREEAEGLYRKHERRLAP